MKNIKAFLLGISLAALAAPTLANTELVRYALVAASNDGGAARVKLKYAESDALSLSKVFEELGGVEGRNKSLVISPTRDELLSSIEKMRARVEAEQQTEGRKEFVFYYSGHSDDQGLLLKDGRLDYKTLRDNLHAINTDVRVAILDSCQSGAFTRLKGGSRKPPFLVDASNRVKGNVFLAASSDSEAAQESDKIGGSFFTHYLISALRGAGDISADKKVTLNEAYHYAYQETLARTEKTQAGAQHPEYDIQIAGAGDLVLTDLTTTNSSMIVSADIVGRLYIRDTNGRLVLELNKIVNHSITLSIEDGAYSILLDASGQLYKAELSVEHNRSAILRSGDLVHVEGEKNIARGADENDRSLLNRIAHRMVSSTVKNPNQVTFGVVKRTLWLGYLEPNIQSSAFNHVHSDSQILSLSYDGQAVTFNRLFSSALALSLSYYHIQEIGYVDGLIIQPRFSIVGSGFTRSSGVRLVSGFGLYFEKYHLPDELAAVAWRAESLNRDRFHWGASIPLTLQLEMKQMVVEAGTEMRFEDGSSPDFYDYRFVSVGIRF